MTDTKDRILDAAQRLIGEQGYAATSVRHIISEAGVNLAAIHYHFGSKEDLLDAVIARKAGPINRERMVRLERLKGETRGHVRKLLEAFLEPMAATADEDPGFVKLMGRMMAEGMLMAIVQKHFRETAELFIEALRRVLPEVPEEEFRWRTHFMFGAMAHTMISGKNAITGVDGGSGDFRGRIDRLVTFLEAGFQASRTQSGVKR